MEFSLVAGSSPTSCFYPSKGCGEAHPNGVGYQRFLKSANLFDGGWIERVMEDKASTEFADGITLERLWSLSFGVSEIYPALWSRSFARADRTGDQHDAYSIAAWLSRADQDGSLAAFLKPELTPPERAVAQVE